MTDKRQKQLDHLVQQIVENYKPEKIILFGSMARGAADSSDVDLFIIKNDVPVMGRDRYYELVKGLTYSMPCDFLVYTPHEVKKRLYLGDPFVKQIIEEGKVLYAG